MKGAREQLLDIKSKTQYQPSRWSSVTHIHTTREPKLHWLAEVRSYLKIFMMTASHLIWAKRLSLPYIYLGTNEAAIDIVKRLFQKNLSIYL